LLCCLFLAGCRGPVVTDTYDRVNDTITVRLGPLPIEGSLFGEMHLVAVMPGHFSPQAPPEKIHAYFRYVAFRKVTLRADDKVIVLPRKLFEEYGVVLTPEDLLEVVHARRVIGRFDLEDDEFTFDETTRLAFVDFARRIRLLSPESGDTAEGAVFKSARVGESTSGGRRICEIQGKAHRSPLLGQEVGGVEGVVTRVEVGGFFLEDPSPDGDVATSEGIFVYTRTRPGVEVGERVRVDGRVTEFYPGGKRTGNLSTTQISAPRVERLDVAGEPPAVVRLGASGRRAPVTTICDDAIDGDVESVGVCFDPAEDGIDFYESLESMRVAIDEALVVGATNRYGEVWVLPDAGRGASPRTVRGGMLRLAGDLNPERVQLQFMRGKAPRVRVGDRLSGVRGVMAFAHGNFELRVDSEPKLRRGGLAPETTSLRGDADRITIASYNVRNLAATSGERIVRIGRQVVERLGSPDVLALQELQDDNGAKDDEVVSAKATFDALIGAINEAGGPRYEFRQIDPADDADGGQPGGNIRVGFLFRPGRVSFVDRASAVGVTASPALIGVGAESFEGCRKSLYGEFRFSGRSLHVIVNHLSSKSGSPPTYGRRQPPGDRGEERRIGQAARINAAVDMRLSRDPDAGVVVLGDMNDFPRTRSLATLVGSDGALVNLVDRLPASDRYTYIFEGNAQWLDHVLVSRALAGSAEIDAVHANCEFPDAASDHDPVIVRLRP